MSKMSLKWHKDCLINMAATLEREEYSLKNQYDRVTKLKKDMQFYSFQIEEAERLKKDGFDEDRFRVAKASN